jgi:hypothetical protein
MEKPESRNQAEFTAYCLLLSAFRDERGCEQWLV